MKAARLLSLSGSVLLLCGCNNQSKHEDAQTEQVKLSEIMADDLQATLGPKLKSALQNGGPEQALVTCQQMAQPLTKSLSGKYPDATINRVALRYRNPSNKADLESASILEQWEATLASGETLPASAITEDQDHTVIHQPILMQAVCLKCHGATEAFSPELQQLLTKHYPDDQATGFKIGELRGAFRIEFSSK